MMIIRVLSLLESQRRPMIITCEPTADRLPDLDLRPPHRRADHSLGLRAATSLTPGPGAIRPRRLGSGLRPHGRRLVGHSLVGLLAQLMAQDSRSRLWGTISAQPPIGSTARPRPARACAKRSSSSRCPGYAASSSSPPPPGEPSRSGYHPRARHAIHPAWGPRAAGSCVPLGEQPSRFLPRHVPGRASHQRRPTDVGPSAALGPSRPGDRSGGAVSLDHRRPP
jgi:hypothetical protein